MNIKDENKIIRVALYIRVSTDRQAKEGDSLEAQESALREYAKKNKYKIVDTYIDGGESGQKLKRTNLQRMLNDVECGKVDLIIMTKLDRWFRSISGFYKVQEIIARNHVNWKTIWEDYDTTTASGEFWLNMSLSLGQMEAKRTGERIDSVFDYKYKEQKTACTGSPVYGYKIDKDKKFIPDEQKAQNIRDLYNYYIKTNKLIETVIWFQKNCEYKSYDSIKLYLKNSAYIGKFVRKKTGEIIENYYPAIIDEEIFEIVQDMLKKNIKKTTGRKNKEPYIFSGLLVCAECGRKLSGRFGSRENLHYYRCKQAITGTSCHNKYNYPELQLEKFIKENLILELNKYIVKIENIKEKKNEKDDNRNKIKNKLKKLADLYVNDMIDIVYYEVEYTKLQNELKDEENKFNKAEKKINFSEIEKFLKSDFISIYEKLDNKDKRSLLITVIDYIKVFKKEDFIIQFK